MEPERRRGEVALDATAVGQEARRGILLGQFTSTFENLRASEWVELREVGRALDSSGLGIKRVLVRRVTTSKLARHVQNYHGLRTTLLCAWSFKRSGDGSNRHNPTL